MKNYIVYKTSTGEILRSGVCQDMDLSLQAATGEEVLEGIVNDLIHIIDTSTGDVISKPIIPSTINKTTMSADGVDKIVISNIPNPTSIQIKDEGSWEVTDGVFELTTDTVGKYIVKLTSNLYLDKEYSINAS